jgi:hypothetical protein
MMDPDLLHEPLVSRETHGILVAAVELIRNECGHYPALHELESNHEMKGSFTLIEGKEILLTAMALDLWSELVRDPDIIALPDPENMIEGPDIVKAPWWQRYTATGTDAMMIVLHSQVDICARILWKRLLVCIRS